LEERPFAKSTLQLFRAHLILHERVRAVFQKSLDFARQTGYFQSRKKLKIVLDTSYILGRGSVKDTYNLLGDGIRKLVRALAAIAAQKPKFWAGEHGLERYFGSSLKGEATIDWDDPEVREVFLQGVVVDADRLLMVAREAMEKLSTDDPLHQRLHEASGLLARLLMQDIERREDGAHLKQGVSSDRIVSVHDPEMRHGRKSARWRFDGHKAAIAVDPESQLITAADVLPGNAQDHERALELVEQARTNADVEVEETVGDSVHTGTVRLVNYLLMLGGNW
jgi:Transposase DDE domain